MKLSTRLRLWWQRVYLRPDEFDKSYSMDVDAMMEMSKDERSFYEMDLTLRREIAHYRDLAKNADKERNLGMAAAIERQLKNVRKVYRKTGKVPQMGMTLVSVNQ